MSWFWYYISCQCCQCCSDKTDIQPKQTKTQKIRNLKTLEKITPQTEKAKIWSDTKDPIYVKTQEMTDIFRIPEQFKCIPDVLNSLGYKELCYIDKGSFGTVSKAIHLKSKLEIAIKVISIPEPTTKDMLRERLNLLIDVKNELYILQKIRHPHIIRMIQHFMIVTNGRQMDLNIVMQLAGGGTLSHMCELKGPFDEPQCQLWFAQMLSGLSYMHSKGIAHRDLKQSNILLDGTQECLISDFGLSRLVWRQSRELVLMSNTFCGTPPYIAPEILVIKKSMGQYNAFQADVWALGVILFKLYENTYPFSKRTAKALRAMNEKKWHFSQRRRPSPQLKHMMADIFETDPTLRPSMEKLQTYDWIKDVFILVEQKSTQKMNQNE